MVDGRHIGIRPEQMGSRDYFDLIKVGAKRMRCKPERLVVLAHEALTPLRADSRTASKRVRITVEEAPIPGWCTFRSVAIYLAPTRT